MSVHDLDFPTQQTAAAWFKELLGRCRDYERIAGPDHDRLLALLARHPQAATKIGRGVSHFYASPAGKGGFGTRCFHVVRTDDSGDDFSYVSCVTGRPRTPLDDFHDAAREAVQGRLMDYKRAWFDKQNGGEVRCPESGEPITFDNSHVDHRPPIFVEICRMFLEETSLIPDYKWISPPADNQVRATITNESIKQAFIDFHNEKANLRVISAAQNLRHGRHLERPMKAD